MKPTTFGQRLGAYFIDILVLLPLGLAPVVVAFVSPQMGVFLRVLITPLGFAYAVYFIAKRGQTIGKRSMKIKVVRSDGSEVGMRDAVLRSLIDLFFAVALGISSFVASMTILAQQGDSEKAMGFAPIVQLLNAGQNEGFGQVVSILSIVYAMAQLICFFATPERRFIHDLVANTRVIQTPSIVDDAAFAAN